MEALDAGWFFDDEIDFGNFLVFLADFGAPSGEHDDRGLGGFGLDCFGNLATVQFGHAQIRDDRLERLIFCFGGAK